MSTGVMARRQSRAATMTEAGGTKATEHPVARFRPRELYRLMAIRHGRKLSMDEAGTRFRDRMLDTFAMSGASGRRRAANFLILRCPWMTEPERSHAVDIAFDLRRIWSAEALGNDLDVTEPEHQRARIRTFRVAGMTDAAMTAKRKAADAARKQAKRDGERLHPKEKASKPALRLNAILQILPRPGEWVYVQVICKELVRRKVIHFAALRGPSLTSAVHDAVKLGLTSSVLNKRFVNGQKLKMAQICRRALA